MPRFSSQNTLNADKFKELILYVASQCEQDTYWNSTKLNKILFYSDFLAYKVNGQSITGADYFALERGPAPKALVPIREGMIKA
ncbi:MAG: Panacea domain-containing protein, partial [Nitrospira sp.]|nr:Panacea domain-containing protein [Nitrospira sp.]